MIAQEKTDPVAGVRTETGIDVLEARGAAFEFLPSLAFAVILLSNLVLLIGTFRTRGMAPVVEASAEVAAESA